VKRTKNEVIGVVFSKLRPKSEDVFADIGCGSCAVSNFFADYVTKVYAVDLDESVGGSNVKDNVEILIMHGLEFLREYDYDLVFFGGTKDIEEMLEVAVEKARRVVVNLARMEMACRVMEKLKELEAFDEILIVGVAKGYELSGMTAFKPLNPVFIVVGSGREKG